MFIRRQDFTIIITILLAPYLLQVDGLSCYICGTQPELKSGERMTVLPDPCVEQDPYAISYYAKCPPESGSCFKLVTYGGDRVSVQRGCSSPTTAFGIKHREDTCGYTRTYSELNDELSDSDSFCKCETDYCNKSHGKGLPKLGTLILNTISILLLTRICFSL